LNASNVGSKEEEITRWTSSKTNSLESPIGCTTSFQEEDKEDMLSAAAAGELPI